ncbi:MAG: nucleotide sugar dehydrogenase [Cytophagia bacterium]|nr:nucleotide sugar dehydrogenase [Cytophagia bacterium]
MHKIAILGLGYVGLPLAVEFAKKFPVIGFDINSTRVDELRNGLDKTLEVEKADLNSVLIDTAQASFSNGLLISDKSKDIANANIYIVTVPTPIDEYKRPDLCPLLGASKIVGQYIKKNDIVIYESTVYPGATEEDCIPVIEEVSGLKFNTDFFAGYSPERINPGDKVNTLKTIKKVTSGSTPEIANVIDGLYNEILINGTFKATSIKVAEASKVIENAQRDLNISFVNELALIFDRLGIDTNDVIEAAGSKWNFLKFKPGLVGGHCIGVDPYYLAFKAESVGYYPQVIRSGRRVNDFMPNFVADKVVKLMIKKGQKILHSKVLVLGITFKENCPDIRNTKVVDVVHELEKFGCDVDIYDPWADPVEVNKEYDLDILPVTNNKSLITSNYDAIVLAVSHDKFKTLDYSKLTNGSNAVVFDIKGVLPAGIVNCRL